MTPRPGRLQDVVPIPLPRPRTPETLTRPEFHSLCDLLSRKLFAGEAPAARP